MNMTFGPSGPMPPNEPPEGSGAASARLGPLQRLSLTAITAVGHGGLTAMETSTATGRGTSSIQPRISELRRKGLVVPSGQRRRNPSGKTAIAWIARKFAANPASPSHQ